MNHSAHNAKEVKPSGSSKRVSSSSRWKVGSLVPHTSFSAMIALESKVTHWPGPSWKPWESRTLSRTTVLRLVDRCIDDTVDGGGRRFGGVPHWTAVCCAAVSIRCPPWCPRLVLYSTPPPWGPDRGGLFRCTERAWWIKDKRRRKSRRKAAKIMIQEELSCGANASQKRWDSKETQPRVICVNLVMDMLCDSICRWKWVMQHQDGESRWSSTQQLAGYKRMQTDRTTEPLCLISLIYLFLSSGATMAKMWSINITHYKADQHTPLTL